MAFLLNDKQIFQLTSPGVGEQGRYLDILAFPILRWYFTKTTECDNLTQARTQDFGEGDNIIVQSAKKNPPWDVFCPPLKFISPQSLKKNWTNWLT